MALQTDFDPSDSVVSLGCNDSEKRFHVHEHLLHDKLPNIEVPISEQPMIYLELDFPYATVSNLARWLYTGSIPNLDSGNANMGVAGSIEDIQAGQDLQCVAFQDAALDVLIDELINPDGYDLAETFSRLLQVFEDGSAGRQYAVDFFVYYAGYTSLERSTYEGLRQLKDPDFIGAVAREICKYQNINAGPESFESEQSSMTVVMGYLEMKTCDDNFWQGMQWWDPRDGDGCRYHRHTELGLPCYRA
ncbi:hypothetical protein LTR37_011242 [Vermiconidia calcicola]|uniref:Uncharacterized protein n=1 Tax=Vermiconidia calcicola TaxID=1690605 RepID=A0ACC3N348_9PEZI|nr:hypothetical protein LTR37_011242 [Vermiconidia calcicola]